MSWYLLLLFLFIAVCHRFFFQSTKSYAQFCQIIFSLLIQSICFFSFHAFKFQNGLPYWIPEEKKTRDKYKKKLNRSTHINRKNCWINSLMTHAIIMCVVVCEASGFRSICHNVESNFDWPCRLCYVSWIFFSFFAIILSLLIRCYCFAFYFFYK